MHDDEAAGPRSMAPELGSELWVGMKRVDEEQVSLLKIYIQNAGAIFTLNCQRKTPRKAWLDDC